MVKSLVTSSRLEAPMTEPKPVVLDEIEPEAMDEITKRVEQMRCGVDIVFSNEEVLRDVDPKLLQLAEQLDDLT